MLVVTRKTDERIYFPGINTFVQIVETRPGSVRLGIEGPKMVLCVREGVPFAPQEDGRFLKAAERAHVLGGKLNSTSIGLGLLRKQIEANRPQEEILTTIQRMVAGLEITDAVPVIKQFPKRRPHALLVEDDENQRELVAGLLRLHSFDVDTTDSGNDAIHRLMDVKDKPDIVLLDVGLGKGRMDGCEVARSIRKNPDLNGTKIVMVTGTEAPARVPNVDRWLMKPVKPERLLQEIDQLCSVA